MPTKKDSDDGFTVKHGGRTLVITTYVNTDETYEDLVGRIQAAAQGESMSLTVVTGAELLPESAEAFWEMAIAAAKKKMEGMS